jgi:AhpD family alkylhydroperoxidase
MTPEQEEPCCGDATGDDEVPCCADAADTSCCAPAGDKGKVSLAGGAGVAEIQKKFKQFMGAASAPGALDVATKQAVNIALSVLARCGPCVKAHVKKAKAMGFTDDEIEEAAWLAIAFGGGPVMMFYNAIKAELAR